MQNNLFFSADNEHALRLPLAQGDVVYYPHWLTHNQASDYFDTLVKEVDWRQDQITMFGKTMNIPRLQAWYGDAHCAYRYSGLSLKPKPFSAALLALKEACEQTIKSPLNCVLANWYRNGQDSMSMHADDEPELGERPVIASVTLGAARNFDFKHKHSGEKFRLPLEHGSLLVMSKDTQQHYMHGIAKTKRCHSPRINLTYRYISPS